MKKSSKMWNKIVKEINRLEKLRKLEDPFGGPTSQQ